MSRLKALAALLATTLAACNGADSQRPDSAAAAAPMLVVPEDLVVVGSDTDAGGAVITGAIQPERRADLRAEMGALVLQVVRENGERVKKGDLLVRLDDASIRENLASSDAAARAAQQAMEQTERQFQRLKRLRGLGLASLQELEEAESRRNSAQSDLAAARSRTAQARQQLQRTEVRAPFDGVTSGRNVSPGDTVQAGKELIKVIDPSSMRFEGLVSADRIASVQTGQAVEFQIHGYDKRSFAGKVKRVDPAASAATRQVAVLVEFNSGNEPLLTGLYAEGRIIGARSAAAVSVKSSALVREDGKTYAWRISNGALHKVGLEVGERDPRHGNHAVRSGLSEGDTIMRRPVSSIKDGQKVIMAPPVRPQA